MQDAFSHYYRLTLYSYIYVVLTIEKAAIDNNKVVETISMNQQLRNNYVQYVSYVNNIVINLSLSISMMHCQIYQWFNSLCLL